jgi:hypothetical protein
MGQVVFARESPRPTKYRRGTHANCRAGPRFFKVDNGDILVCVKLAGAVQLFSRPLRCPRGLVRGSSWLSLSQVGVWSGGESFSAGVSNNSQAQSNCFLVPLRCQRGLVRGSSWLSLSQVGVWSGGESFSAGVRNNSQVQCNRFLVPLRCQRSIAGPLHTCHRIHTGPSVVGQERPTYSRLMHADIDTRASQ